MDQKNGDNTGEGEVSDEERAKLINNPSENIAEEIHKIIKEKAMKQTFI